MEGILDSKTPMTFLSSIKPYLKQVLLVSAFMLLSNLLALALPWGIKIIIDEVLVHKNGPLLNLIIVVLGGILILRSLFNFFRKYMSNIVGEKIICDLREKIFWHIHQLTMGSIKKITPS